MNVPKTPLKSLLIVPLLAVFGLSVYGAPGFLAFSDQPVKSDAVVLFLGDERGTREKEANQLILEGYADFLIIPAYRQVEKRGPDGTLIKIDIDFKLQTSNFKLNTPEQRSNQQNWFVEATHKEALIARDMMNRLRVSSAILVSSPYHMRRIKVIAGRVFGERATVFYVPTRYETLDDGFWLFNSYDRKFVLREYAKIGWFLLYSPFV